MSARSAGATRLKIGIVCEGQRGCAEVQVFPHLIKLICPDAETEIVPSGNRPTVLNDAPKHAKHLFDQGCDAVFVVWDVFPEWRDEGGTTDCREHNRTLEGNLCAAGMAKLPIIPVAIHEELEAWLLCDADPLNSLIEPLNKQIQHTKNPDDVANPKVVLTRLFERGRGKRFNPSFSAGQIAARLTSTDRLRKSQSFRRFEDRLRLLCQRTR